MVKLAIPGCKRHLSKFSLELHVLTMQESQWLLQEIDTFAHNKNPEPIYQTAGNRKGGCCPSVSLFIWLKLTHRSNYALHSRQLHSISCKFVKSSSTGNGQCCSVGQPRAYSIVPLICDSLSAYLLQVTGNLSCECCFL